MVLCNCKSPLCVTLHSLLHIRHSFQMIYESDLFTGWQQFVYILFGLRINIDFGCFCNVITKYKTPHGIYVQLLCIFYMRKFSLVMTTAHIITDNGTKVNIQESQSSYLFLSSIKWFASVEITKLPSCYMFTFSHIILTNNFNDELEYQGNFICFPRRVRKCTSIDIPSRS